MSETVPTMRAAIPPLTQRRSPREMLTAAALFVATVLTATFAGMQQAVGEVDLQRTFPGGIPEPASIWGQLDLLGQIFAAHWTAGLPFSAALLGILATHELGHFFAGRWHRIDVSLPYFIPAPTLIGTFGAVIRMRGPLWHRSGLLDVGAAGPLAGFVVAVPVYIWGMAHSQIISGAEASEAMFFMGDSLLTAGIQWAVHGVLPADADVMLHPVAFAGWIGLFVTSLNLIPMGQLDGGHILYALWPRAYPLVGRAALLGLLTMGLLGWKGWFVWAILGLLLGVDRHPPTLVHEPALTTGRRLEGAAAAALFALTFVPNPFTILV